MATATTEEISEVRSGCGVNDNTSLDDVTTMPSSGPTTMVRTVDKVLSSSSASALSRLSVALKQRSPRVGVSSEWDCESDVGSAVDVFSWAPVMPGYKLNELPLGGGLQHESTIVVEQHSSESVEQQQQRTTTHNNNNNNRLPTANDVGLKQAIPVMSKPLAVVCCLLNILSPGLGTFVSGLTLLCFSQPQQPNADRSNLLLVNVWVALFQLITAFLFLLGWLWSLIWAANFITISDAAKRTKLAANAPTTGLSNENEDENETAGGERGGTVSRTTRTTTTTRTMTTTSALHSVASSTEQPIIVLQQAPVTVTASTDDYSLPYRQNHRINRRRNRRRRGSQVGEWTDRLATVDQLTGVLLSPQTLEHIVIHSSVVPDTETPTDIPQQQTAAVSHGKHVTERHH